VLRSFSLASASLFLLATAFSNAEAQRTVSPGVVSVSAQVGGKSYGATGAGSCRHSPSASIYDVPAALWMVEQSGEGAIKSVHLTLWRPKDGSSDQVSLSLQTRSSSHVISSGGKAEPVGDATVKLLPLGPGGRFELKGKDGAGAKVQVIITCPAFTGVEAEGG
jgi:hypothetical protein